MKLPFFAIFSFRYRTLLARPLRLPMLATVLHAALLGHTHAASIYKSVDRDGNVIFTDQPLEGAEPVNENAKNARTMADQVNDDPTIDPSEQRNDSLALTPEPSNPPKQAAPPSEPEAPRPPVTLVEILTPIHNATLRDPIGSIWVELQSYPTPLKKSGLTAELWMNDQLIAKGRRPMLSMDAPERGTHVLQVRLVDDKGRVVLTSKPSHIHVRYRVAGD